MNPIQCQEFFSQPTREAVDAINQRIGQAEAALAAAQHRADVARQADPLSADVDDVLSAGNELRRARVEHLRAEIQIRRDMEPVFQAIAADQAAEVQQAESELAAARMQVENGLRGLGLGHLLAYRDIMGNNPNEALILQSELVAPANRRYLSAKLATQSGMLRQENHRALQGAMQRLRAEFEKAADGTAAT